jgi:hypothetical protein
MAKRIIFFLIFCFTLIQGLLSQYRTDVLRDTSLIGNDVLQTLKQEYGQRKEYPVGYEKIILYSLSYFPELKNIRVHFKVRKTGAPLSSSPSWGGIFRSAKKRTYMVFIRDGGDSSMFSSIFARASMPGKIGIIGHELCHVSYFSGKSGLGLMGIGISHISKPYMDRFEFRTDSNCIAHGLGYYLKEWAGMFDKMFMDSDMKDPFKNSNTPTGERYMSAATIEKYIQKINVVK